MSAPRRFDIADDVCKHPAAIGQRRAAWILEKFKVWTNAEDAAAPAIDRDPLLTNVMLYWLSSEGAQLRRRW
jgi:hypothetical protein